MKFVSSSKILAASALFALAAPAYAGTVTVRVNGVSDVGGTIYVSVQNREQFMTDDATETTIIKAPKPGSHTLTYDVPDGEYVVSVWHDDNNNGQFDKDEYHTPRDGWAMVNGERLRGEPQFDQVKTTVSGSLSTIDLNMVYFMGSRG
ncbi:MAG: DUF2141 domain-containing protein [Erythrobacter sp.]|uniref:DUF2141 domain-containing protein n=1 Tax=Erythrobacter sp. TaxID=1042 RepID=UPI003265359B